MEQQGIYERIKERVGQLKAESGDHFFTEYLVKLDSRLIQQKYQLDLIETELERNCRIYRQRMSVLESVSATPEQSQTPAANEPYHEENTTAAQEQMQEAPRTVFSEPQQAEVPKEVQTAPAPEMARGAFSAGTFLQQTPPPPPPYSQPQAAPRQQKNHEFTVGINVFGTIGILFVLAALILLGINYMGSLIKELGLYVLGLLVWGVAEFVVKKKNQIISMIFSSLGIGCLYVTTMVNYLYLHNFNALVTILITTGITVVVMLVSRHKDAGILRIICIGACMVSFLTMDTLHMVSDMELLIYMVMILIVQLLGIFLPVKKWAYGIAVGQMAGTAVFTLLFAIFTVPANEVMELRALYVIGFVVLSMLLMELIVWRTPAESKEKMRGLCIAFGIGAFFLECAHYQCAVGLFSWHRGEYSDIEIWIRVGVMAAIVLMGVIFFFLTRNKGYLRWIQGYFVAGTALFMLGNGSHEQLSVTITLAILIIVYKLLAYRQKPLWTADAIITTWTALAALTYYDSVYGYVLLGVLLLSILLLGHWQTYFELLLTGTAVLFIAMAVDNELMLPLMIAVMWLATLLFNHVKRFVGKGILGFNLTILVMETACYLILGCMQEYDSVIIYFILTVLGLGIILFTLQPKISRVPTSWRGLTIAGFLTYMVIVTRFEVRITASILMMLVGLFGIVLGFRQSDRKLRIYGLVLCMLMCFKITLFDFDVQSLQRIILFMVAGVVALAISGIYALMDRKYHNKEDENPEREISERERGR